MCLGGAMDPSSAHEAAVAADGARVRCEFELLVQRATDC